MNVKSYIAPNVQEAMIKIKNELGRDAIILHTRKIKQKGFKGLFKKQLVEVVAAIQDEQEITKTVEAMPVKAIAVPEKVAPPPVILREVEKPVERIIENVKEDNSQIESLKSEIDEIKDLLKTYIAKPSNVIQEDVLVDEINDVEKETRDFLKSLEIKDTIIEKIITIVKRQVSLTPQNEPMVRSAVRQAIKDYIGEPFTIDDFPGEQRVFLFAGPTGVGKTTTLAKLAAKLSLLDNKKVGLITADTYRIAAVDQLKTYSEILGIPLSVVYEASELGDVMYKYKDKDVVLLDTAGRSHKSDELSRDLQDLMNNLENPEIFLVISLTTGYKDIVSILDAYSFIDKYRLIFTKLDEASTYSNILNVKVESGHELSYITNGQSVPDDIEIAESEKIANYIVGEAK